MFREHARLFAILQFIADVVLSGLAFLFAYWVRINIGVVTPDPLSSVLNPELYPVVWYLPFVALAIAWWSVVAFSLGLYRLSIRRSDWERIRIILESAVLMGLFLGFLSYAIKLDLSRPLTAFFVVAQACLLSLSRVGITLHGRRRHLAGSRRNILIVGCGEKARDMGGTIARYSDWGLNILGYIERDGEEPSGANMRILGKIADIPQIVEENVVDELIFVGSRPSDLQSLDEILAICNEQGIRTRVAIDMFPSKVSSVSMEFLENVPLLTFSTTPDHAFSLLIKRVMDIVGSAILMVCLVPLMLVVGLLEIGRAHV
jgi:FlaA1/EpsC-like NDP-sugar epimerase